MIVWDPLRADGVPKMQFPRWRRWNIKVTMGDFEMNFKIISWISKSFRNGLSTLCSCLQMANLYIKRWTPNFLLDRICFQPPSSWLVAIYLTPWHSLLVFHAHESLISTFLRLFIVHKPKSLIYAYLTSSTSLVENDFCIYSSLKFGIRLKIEVRSITRVLASIWVKLDDLNFLYYINHIICVIWAHILAPSKYKDVLITMRGCTRDSEQGL